MRILALLLLSATMYAQTCVRVREVGTLLTLDGTPANGTITVTLGYVAINGQYTVVISNAAIKVVNGSMNQCFPPAIYGTARFVFNNPSGGVYPTTTANWYIPATGGPYSVQYAQSLPNSVTVSQITPGADGTYLKTSSGSIMWRAGIPDPPTTGGPYCPTATNGTITWVSCTSAPTTFSSFPGTVFSSATSPTFSTAVD